MTNLCFYWNSSLPRFFLRLSIFLFLLFFPSVCVVHSTGVTTDNILLVGDFNAYGAEEPITFLLENGYTSLLDPATCPYTYVFDGQWGTLDYAFVKDSVACHAEAEPWHVNSDEADLLNYNLDFGRNPDIYTDEIPERFSDHDPIVVGMDLSGKKCKANKKGMKGMKLKKKEKKGAKGKKLKK